MFRRISPPQIIVGSFALAALLGTALLSLPQASTREPLKLVDALFISISALCVTGLSMVDIGTRLTPFGQGVVLGLIQAGGLGIMSFSVLFFTLLGRRISFRDRFAMAETLGRLGSLEILRLVRFVFIYTFILETVGAGLLLGRFIEVYSFSQALWHAIFTSVSAFCNAGFSLFSKSFVDFRGDLYVNLIITSLIITGGLGFVVLADIWDTFLYKIWRRSRKVLSLHSRLVLVTTLALLMVGSFAFFSLEVGNSLGGLPLREKLLASYFQAVTPRTAGFNTVEFSQVTDATLFFTILLMFIGASPGSTGGGIKTSTLATILAAALNWVKGRPTVHMFHRTISQEVVGRALAIAATNLALVTLGTLALVSLELGGQAHGAAARGFLDYFFEVTSALGTVGLSTGVTPGLSSAGKLLVAAIMFMGRVGPLTLAIALGTRETRAALKYAEERVMIG